MVGCTSSLLFASLPFVQLKITLHRSLFRFGFCKSSCHACSPWSNPHPVCAKKKQKKIDAFAILFIQALQDRRRNTYDPYISLFRSLSRGRGDYPQRSHPLNASCLCCPMPWTCGHRWPWQWTRSGLSEPRRLSAFALSNRR